MDFPWADVLGGLGLPILIVILMCSPMIIGALIGQIIKLITFLY